MRLVRSHRYRDRVEAGETLAELVAARLAERGRSAGRPIVLGLPRGGVPVAAPVADRLDAELDVLTVRKIGTPGQRELAMGAVASGDLTVFNEDLIDRLGLRPRVIEERVQQARHELAAQDARLRGGRPAPELTDRVVVIVDDGLATGATMQAAARAVRTAAPALLVAAVPVGAPESSRLIAALTDVFVCPLQPVTFSAVGQWYVDFSATSDDDVERLLAGHR